MMSALAASASNNRFDISAASLRGCDDRARQMSALWMSSITETPSKGRLE
jgi:hypothetical protein